jgi:hypothetical protein
MSRYGGSPAWWPSFMGVMAAVGEIAYNTLRLLRQQDHRSRYPRRRLSCAKASNALPASISSAWNSTNSCPFVPVRPRLRTRRTVPDRSRSIMRP